MLRVIAQTQLEALCSSSYTGCCAVAEIGITGQAAPLKYTAGPFSFSDCALMPIRRTFFLANAAVQCRPVS